MGGQQQGQQQQFGNTPAFGPQQPQQYNFNPASPRLFSGAGSAQPFPPAPTNFGPAQNLGAQGNQPSMATPAWQPNAANQWQSGPPAPIGAPMGPQMRPQALQPPVLPAASSPMGGPQMGGSAAGTGLSPQPMNLFGSLSGGGAGKF